MGDIKARKKSLILNNRGHISPSMDDDDGICTFCLDSMDVEMLKDDIAGLFQKLKRSPADGKMEEGYGKGVQEEGKEYGKEILERKANYKVTPNPDPKKEQKNEVLLRKEKEDGKKKEEVEEHDGAEKKDEEKKQPQEDGELKSESTDTEMESNEEELDEEKGTLEKGKNEEKKDKEKENSEEEKDICEEKVDSISAEGESKLMQFHDLNQMGEEKKAMADEEEEETEICQEKDDNTSGEGESKLLQDLNKMGEEKKAMADEEEEEKEVCHEKDDNSSGEGESKLMQFQELIEMGEEKKALVDEEEEEKEVCDEKPVEDKESTVVTSLKEEGLLSSELEAELDKTLLEINDTYLITHVGDGNQSSKSSGQQSSSSTNQTSSSSSTNGQPSRASGGLHSVHGGGGDGVSGGDEQPPNRGPPSRLPSQCEGYDQAQAAEQKKADKFGDYFCQGLELPNTLDDDVLLDPPENLGPLFDGDVPSDPPGSLHSHSLDPDPSASASYDLESFQEMVSAGSNDQSLLKHDVFYVRHDKRGDLTPSEGGKYREGKEYEKGDKLGEGSYGQVYEITDKTSNKTFAMKKIPWESFSSKELNGRHLHQRNFPEMYGAMITTETNSEGEEILVVVYIIQELIPNSVMLQQVVEHFADWNFSPDQLVVIFQQILMACIEMHSKGITHGDLHSGNVLITEGLRVVLIDWGQSTVHDLTEKQAFRKAAALDVQLASDRINELITCFLRQRETQKDIQWESDDATIALLMRVLDKVPRINGSSRDTPTATGLLEELKSGLAENTNLLCEIADGMRPAIRPRTTGQTTPDNAEEAFGEYPVVEEPLEVPSLDEAEGAVGGLGHGSLMTDDDSLPFRSASSTYDSNLSYMEFENF